MRANTALMPTPPPPPRYGVPKPYTPTAKPDPNPLLLTKKPPKKIVVTPAKQTRVIPPPTKVAKSTGYPDHSTPFGDGINLGQFFPHMNAPEVPAAPAVADDEPTVEKKQDVVSKPFDASPFDGRIAKEHQGLVTMPATAQPKKVEKHPLLQPAPKVAAKSREEIEAEKHAAEVARKQALIARRKGMKGLKGFCPVVLRDKRDLADTNVTYAATFEGRTWFFSSATARDAFAKSPGRYAPVEGGHDVVLLASHKKQQEGSLDNAVWYRDRLYLFDTKDSLHVFASNPSQYHAAKHEPAADDKAIVEPNRLPEETEPQVLPKPEEKQPPAKTATPDPNNPFVIPEAPAIEEKKPVVKPVEKPEAKVVAPPKVAPKPEAQPAKKSATSPKVAPKSAAKTPAKQPVKQPKTKPAPVPSDDPFAPLDGGDPNPDEKLELPPLPMPK